ncbi:hypothetical protein [Kiloniella sp.]|uniref:hypothetical protein n=1 Tax=Kiloniella sp. TaxID=1938587 RepID=UPI003B012E1C
MLYYICYIANTLGFYNDENTYRFLTEGWEWKNLFIYKCCWYGTPTWVETVLIDLDPQGSSQVWGDIRKDKTLGIMSAAFPRLGKIIEAAKSENIEFVIIDVPPKSSDAALAACKIADLVIIPVVPDIYDLAAIDSALSIAQFSKAPHQIILNKVPLVGNEQQSAIEVVKSLNGLIAPVTLYQRKPVGQSQAEGLCLEEFIDLLRNNGKLQKSHLNAVKEMTAFWDWISSSLGLRTGNLAT